MNNDLYKIVETLCKWIIIPSIYVCVFCLSIIFLSSFIYNVIAFIGFDSEFIAIVCLVTGLMSLIVFYNWIGSIDG